MANIVNKARVSNSSRITDAENVLGQWLKLQHDNLLSTNTVLNFVIELCNDSADSIDQSLLEIYINNIVMHIEVISQYNMSINTLLNNCPYDEYMVLINANKALKDEMIRRYYQLQSSMQEKVYKLKNQIDCTQNIISIL